MTTHRVTATHPAARGLAVTAVVVLASQSPLLLALYSSTPHLSRYVVAAEAAAFWFWLALERPLVARPRLQPWLALAAARACEIILREFSASLTGPAQYSRPERPPILDQLALVTVGPLWEEIVFRGFLLRFLQRRVPTAAAIVLQALAFAAAHMAIGSAFGMIDTEAPHNLSGAITVGVSGLTLGVLTVVTRRLWPAVLVHALGNLAPMLSRQFPDDRGPALVAQQLQLATGLVVIVAAFTWHTLRRPEPAGTATNA